MMKTIPFVPFGAIHWATLLFFTVTFILTFGYLAHAPVASLPDFEQGMAIALLVYYVIDFWIKRSTRGFTWIKFLPIEVCSMQFFAFAIGYLTQNHILLVFCMLVTLSLTFLTFLTPVPAAGFPSLEFFRYFISHGLLIGNAFYLMFVRKLAPSLADLGICFGIIQAQIVLAGVIDYFFDQNFLFLRKKPNRKSIFSYLGPWPYYILGMDALFLTLLFVWWSLTRVI